MTAAYLPGAIRSSRLFARARGVGACTGCSHPVAAADTTAEITAGRWMVLCRRNAEGGWRSWRRRGTRPADRRCRRPEVSERDRGERPRGAFRSGIAMRGPHRLGPIGLMPCRTARSGLDLDQGLDGFEELFRSTTAYNHVVCRHLAKSLSMLSIERAGPQARINHRPLYEPARVPFLYDTMHHAGPRPIASCRHWKSP
jgi:hypothetical protein